MRSAISSANHPLARTFLVGLIVSTLLVGCAGTGAFIPLFGGTPFPSPSGSGSTVTGPGFGGSSSGSSLTGGAFGTVDPCDETQSRKFVRVSMRNYAPDYIHYFVIFIAYVNGDTYPTGAVCPDDTQLYTSFGYIPVAEGSQVELGNLCIEGPALYYYHRNGQFEGAGGALASAIAPAQGSAPSYDNFFSTSAPQVPIPDQIVFQNPGTGEGAALKVSVNDPTPCATDVVNIGDPACSQDAFYYVDENDRLAGSTALGFNSGIRVPDEIQGSACGCGISNQPYSALGASALTASDVSDNSGFCNLFLRGGRIDFAFIRDDTDPPIPQLLWKVSDASGSLAHEYDPRAGIQ